jgi:drug/metabolite transporter (DMT)-like permease
MGGREWAMLLALAVLWGGSFFFNVVAVRELPSFTLVWLRVACATATLLIVLRLLGQRMPTCGRVWLAFFGMGLLNNVLPFVLIIWGQHRIASGLASILNATTPLFTVLVAHLLTPDEKLTPLKAAGVAVGLVGVAGMIGPEALGGFGSGVLAELACLAGALSYAFAGIFGRRFKRMGVAPMATAAGQVSASTLLLLPIMLVVDRPWTLAMCRTPQPGERYWAQGRSQPRLPTSSTFEFWLRPAQRIYCS